MGSGAAGWRFARRGIIGAVRAYLQVKRSGVNASLNLLWAPEGALTRQHGRRWRKMIACA